MPNLVTEWTFRLAQRSPPIRHCPPSSGRRAGGERVWAASHCGPERAGSVGRDGHEHRHRGPGRKANDGAVLNLPTLGTEFQDLEIAIFLSESGGPMATPPQLDSVNKCSFNKCSPDSVNTKTPIW